VRTPTAGRSARPDRQSRHASASEGSRAGVARIIFLGGPGDSTERLSAHLESRREVETMLAAGPVPVTVFRAAMIIGSGSASFEILRYLAERLPVMLTPRWVRTSVSRSISLVGASLVETANLGTFQIRLLRVSRGLELTDEQSGLAGARPSGLSGIEGRRTFAYTFRSESTASSYAFRGAGFQTRTPHTVQLRRTGLFPRGRSAERRYGTGPAAASSERAGSNQRCCTEEAIPG
jgi:hypothetical protein